MTPRVFRRIAWSSRRLFVVFSCFKLLHVAALSSKDETSWSWFINARMMSWAMPWENRAAPERSCLDHKEGCKELRQHQHVLRPRSYEASNSMRLFWHGNSEAGLSLWLHHSIRGPRLFPCWHHGWTSQGQGRTTSVLWLMPFSCCKSRWGLIVHCTRTIYININRLDMCINVRIYIYVYRCI